MCVRDAVASSGERSPRRPGFGVAPKQSFSSGTERIEDLKKFAIAGLRMFPRLCERERSYSPSRRRNCARPYSRLNFAMKLALILAGHTASHS